MRILAVLTGEYGDRHIANVQATLVPLEGATIVEFKIGVPGFYLLVNHALSCLERGIGYDTKWKTPLYNGASHF